ncbi:hypothetical protein B0H10DRAFT_1816390, partial [Mycena sp. CBHHK59/15]
RLYTTDTKALNHFLTNNYIYQKPERTRYNLEPDCGYRYRLLSSMTRVRRDQINLHTLGFPTALPINSSQIIPHRSKLHNIFCVWPCFSQFYILEPQEWNAHRSFGSINGVDTGRVSTSIIDVTASIPHHNCHVTNIASKCDAVVIASTV